jgi:hypothetical protein
MTHAELVQAATDLMFATAQPEKWLSQYDLALASETDQQLKELLTGLQRQIQQTHRIAA